VQLSKSTYQPGEKLFASGLEPGATIQVMKLENVLSQPQADQLGQVEVEISPSMFGSFTLVSENAFAAFDVLNSWTERPRYGFICNFDSNAFPGDVLSNELTKFSSNAVQLYDWHFRHEQLVSPTEVFVDPLGRELSHDVLIQMVATLRSHGIATMGYVAAYATSNEGAEEHSEWLLYDASGQPLDFHGFLKITDIAAGSPFKEHILQQALNAAISMGFTGIHFDQYGEPREGFSSGGKHVDVGTALAELVSEFKSRNPGIPSTLNAVKNWPREKLATANQDFYYMELWEDPNGRLSDVIDEILEPRKLSGNKGVVVAIYITEKNRGSNLIVDSLIQAAGAWRIEFGERDGFLSDPYFPKFETPDNEFLEEARIRNSFAVAMGDVVRSSIPKVEFKVTEQGNLAIFDFSSDDEKVYAIANLGKYDLEAEWGLALDLPRPIYELQVQDLFNDCSAESLRWFSPKHVAGTPVGLVAEGYKVDLVSWGILKGRQKSHA
jgi:hypothetical protein